jgi:hypothetical protein
MCAIAVDYAVIRAEQSATTTRNYVPRLKTQSITG